MQNGLERRKLSFRLQQDKVVQCNEHNTASLLEKWQSGVCECDWNFIAIKLCTWKF